MSLTALKGTRSIPEFLKIDSRQSDIPARGILRISRGGAKKDSGLEEGEDREEGQMRLFDGVSCGCCCYFCNISLVLLPKVIYFGRRASMSIVIIKRLQIRGLPLVFAKTRL